MPVLDWEKIITCPYNIAHQITEGRLQRHLVKCRRNHPDAEVVICKFNSSHHIPLREEQQHLQTCQDRKFVEMIKYGLRLEDKKQVPFKPATRVQDDEEEDWEKEANIKTSYDPRKKASQLPVLRKLEGATKCQRKEFRAHEKERHESLDSESVGRIGCLRRPKVDGPDSARDGGLGGSRMRGVERSVNQQLVRGSAITVARGSQQVVGGEQGRGGAQGVHVVAEDGVVVVSGRGRVGKGRGRVVWG